MVIHEEIPKDLDFNTQFDTYIIAFCPDYDEWFVTNNRFFFYEYPMEFESEQEAVSYFKANPIIFYKEELRMRVYRPSFYSGKVYLKNIDELISI